MRSMRIDCAPVRIATWEELEAYMDGSAGSVGRIMAPLLGVPARHHAGFGRLGLAFQLTNFIRDVREDRALDRVYLPGRGPRALRRRRGATSPRARAAPELRALLAHEVAPRARAVRERRAPRVAAAPALRAARRAARRRASTGACSTASRRVGFDVLGRRAGVPAWQLPGAALGALRR